MIILSWLKQPEDGCVMTMRCNDCRTTTVLHSEHAPKPGNGDNAWLVRNICEKLHWPEKKVEFPKLDPPSWWSVRL